MLRLIPAPLHRAGLQLAHAVRRRWWRIAQTQLNGTRVLAFDEMGRIMLIRHSYGSGNWMMPGGGLNREEDPLAGALRELAEECRCSLANARLFLVNDEPLFGTRSRVHMVCGEVVGTPEVDGREIVELMFFDRDDLPENLSPHLAANLHGWLAAAGR